MYAPQESRTPNTELKKLYKNLETNVRESNTANEKLLLIGDFNCKVREQIQGNSSTITKGGHLLTMLMEQNKLGLLNTSANYHAKWTRIEGGKKICH